MTERGDDERVLDRAAPQQLGDLAQWHGLHRDNFVTVEMRLVRALGIEREEAVQPVVLDRWIRRDRAEPFPLARRVTGLLDELARRSCLRVFTRIDHTSRDLEADLLDTDAILADQHDLL